MDKYLLTVSTGFLIIGFILTFRLWWKKEIEDPRKKHLRTLAKQMAFIAQRKYEGEWVCESNRFLRKNEWTNNTSLIHSVILKKRGSEDRLEFEVDCISDKVTRIQPGDAYTFHGRAFGEWGPSWREGLWKEVSIPLREGDLIPTLISRAVPELGMSPGRA